MKKGKYTSVMRDAIPVISRDVPCSDIPPQHVRLTPLSYILIGSITTLFLVFLVLPELLSVYSSKTSLPHVQATIQTTDHMYTIAYSVTSLQIGNVPFRVQITPLYASSPALTQVTLHPIMPSMNMDLGITVLHAIGQNVYTGTVFMGMGGEVHMTVVIADADAHIHTATILLAIQ